MRATKQLAGASVLLTGASGGLGGHLAHALAAEGATLVLSGRDTRALEALAGALPRAVVVACDLADPRCRPRTDRPRGGSGRPLEVLVNNAGIESAASFAVMHDAGRGHVVKMSSIAGKGGVAYDVAYGAVKAGLAALR